MRIFFTVLLFISCSVALRGQDSTNVRVIEGQKFIEHRVQEKETLYSLSRKYNVPIYRIIEHNPPTEFGLEIGTLINVPIIEKSAVSEKAELDAPKLESKKTSLPSEHSSQRSKEIRHTVETKQTLFSISKIYDVTIDQIRDWNGLTSNSLDIGQVLIIKKIPGATDLPAVEIPKKTRGALHIVEPGDTFYSLSKRFGISIEELKGLNGLVSNELSIGQELIVKAEKGDEVVTRLDSLSTRSYDEKSEEAKDSITKAVEAARKYEESSQPMNFEEVVESGVAEVIQGTDNTRKYLALHRTAKAGTILKVRNDMNDQEVFVRVLGKLPDNLSNKNVLIKLSQAAYNRLGAIDQRFRVTISYIP